MESRSVGAPMIAGASGKSGLRLHVSPFSRATRRPYDRLAERNSSGPSARSGALKPQPYPREGEAVFSQTETCLVLSLVNGSRFQPLQRSRSVIPASRAIRSSSEGHT